MKFRVRDFVESDFFKKSTMFSNVSFIDSEDFEEMEIVSISYDPIADNCRFLLKKV